MLYSMFSYLFLFDVGDDLRMNPFELRRNDTIQATLRDSLEIQVGPVTRLRVKRLKRLLMDFFKTQRLR